MKLIRAGLSLVIAGLLAAAPAAGWAAQSSATAPTNSVVAQSTSSSESGPSINYGALGDDWPF